MKKKSLLTAISVVLVLAMVVGGTLAYLQDQTPEKVNTFQTQTVDVDLSETLGNYNIIPGFSQPKDPKTVVTATVPSYVFLKVNDGTSGLVTWEVDAGWSQLKDAQDQDVSGVWYREISASSTPQELNILKDQQVTYSADITIEQMKAAGTPMLSFTSYVVQKHQGGALDANGNIDISNSVEFTPIEAWNVLVGSGAASQTPSYSAYTTSAIINTGSDTFLSTELGTVNVPAGTTLTDDGNQQISNASALTLNVRETSAADSTIQVGDNEAAEYFDVSLIATVTTTVDAETTTSTSEVKSTSQLVVATLDIGAGKSDVKVYHRSTQMTGDGAKVADHFSYDSTTGIVTMYLDSFSPFTVVYKIPATGIELADTAVSVRGSKKLIPTLTPSDTTDIVSWSSDNTSIATINENGTVTGVAKGSAKITATIGENLSATCTVTVAGLSEEVIEGQETILVDGPITVTVPAAAAKDGSGILTLRVTELTEAEANEAGTFTTAYKYDTKLYKYFNVEVEGLSAENTERLQIQYDLPSLDEGLMYYRYTQVYQGTASSSLSGITTKDSYMSRSNDGSHVTVHSATLGSYTFEYQIQTGSNPKVALTQEVDNGTATATIGYGAYVKSEKVSDLSFSLQPYMPNEAEKTAVYTVLQAQYGKDESNANLIAYEYSFTGFSSMGSNETTIQFPLTISGEYLALYVMRNGSFTPTTISDDGKTSAQVQSDTHGIIFLAYTFETEATKEFKRTIAGLQENGTVKIPQMIDLKDVENELSVDGITITADNEYEAQLVKSSGATINANNLTFTGIDVYSGGLTLNGSNILVQSSTIDQTYGSGSTLSLTGDHGAYTVEYVNLSHMNAASSGRYGALYFEGIRQDLSQEAARANVTTVNYVTLTTAWSYIRDSYIAQYSSSPYYSPEEVQAMFPEDPHAAFQSGIASMLLRNTGGLIYRNFGGTLNVSNADIDVPYSALNIGIDSEPRFGWVNVSDSVINSTSMGTERVDYTCFNNVTFKNTWNNGPFNISSGSSYQGNLNYSFENCTFQTAICFALGTSNINSGVNNPTITFKNCTWNGNPITADNIGQFLTFSMSVSNLKAEIGTVTYDETTGVLTVVPVRSSK